MAAEEARPRSRGRLGAVPSSHLERHGEQAGMMGDLWQALATLRAAEGRLRKHGVEPDSAVLASVVSGQDDLRGVLRALTAAFLKEA
jgi:hypothetical protein